MAWVSMVYKYSNLKWQPISLNIETTSSNFPTPKGLKIGDSIKRAEALYGETRDINDADDISYEYDIGKNVKLRVDFKNSIVVKIYLHEYEE